MAPQKQITQVVKELLRNEDFRHTLVEIVQQSQEELIKRIENIEKNNRETDVRISKIQDDLSAQMQGLVISTEKVESSSMCAENQLSEHQKSIAIFEKKMEEKKYEIRKLENEVNNLEQYSRRSCIRIFGVKEATNEKTDDIVMEVAKKINVDLQHAEIDISHRVGIRDSNAKRGERPIIVKLTSHRKRQELLRNRRKLKSTGITIQEDLTARSRALLQEAYKKYKEQRVSAAWSSEGRIFVAIPTTNGSKAAKKLITCREDLWAL